MYPSQFDYRRPQSMEEALQLLGHFQGEARPIAGGQSLLPLMKLRLAYPSTVIDLNKIPGLDNVTIENDRAVVGALARHQQILQSPLASRVDAVREGLLTLGDRQVRTLGTIGGAVAQSDPAGDWGPVLLALGAQVICRSARGARQVAIEDFFVDYLTPGLSEDELVESIQIDLPPGRSSGTSFQKLERKAGDFAVASAAVRIVLGSGNECIKIGIGLGGVGLTPMRAVSAEASLLGKHVDHAAIEVAVAQAYEDISPLTDSQGPAWYKRDVARTLLKRALIGALERAGGTVPAAISGSLER